MNDNNQKQETPSTPQRSFNPSPKQKFLEVPANISRHRQLVDSPAFNIAADAAVVEYTRVLCYNQLDPASPNFIPESAARHQKLQGMHEFLTVFRGMSELPKPVSPRIVDDNLE